MYAREHQFSGQIQFRRLLGYAQIQFARHNANGIVGRPCGHFNHNICAEYVRRKEHPENVVQE